MTSALIVTCVPSLPVTVRNAPSPEICASSAGLAVTVSGLITGGSCSSGSGVGAAAAKASTSASANSPNSVGWITRMKRASKPSKSTALGRPPTPSTLIAWTPSTAPAVAGLKEASRRVVEATTQKSCRRWSHEIPWQLSDDERFQTFTTPRGCSSPRSTSHQGLACLPVWATEPLSHTPSVLPSTAREAVPPHPVEDMVAVLLRARLSLPLVTVRVARAEVVEPLAFVATA